LALLPRANALSSPIDIALIYTEDNASMNTLFLVRCLIMTSMLAGAVAYPVMAQQPPDTVTSDVHGNTAMGTSALFNLSAASANTAAGAQALEFNTTGQYNSAFGYQALTSNTSGSLNAALGIFALLFNTTGTQNSAFGSYSLYSNTTGGNNTATGMESLTNNTSGAGDTANGYQALYTNTSGNRNNATGDGALFSNTTANDNNAMGTNALHENSTGTLNNAVGNFALEFNSIGNNNNAVGYGSLLNNTTGSDNSGQGYFSLAGNTTGNLNIGVGYKAGVNLTSGSNNIDIGNSGVAAESNIIRIGTPGTQSATFIAGIAGTNISGGATVVVSSSGQLGVVSSSRRYKEDIQPMGSISDRIYALRPVTFRYRQPGLDGSKSVQIGLIAEDVVSVLPELVVYNQDGQPESVAYHLLPTLLLNELQKEHQIVLEQAKQLRTQNERMTDLAAQLTDLEKVTNRLADLLGDSQISSGHSAQIKLAR
jgi:trimeric autotransporter adhesin